MITVRCDGVDVTAGVLTGLSVTHGAPGGLGSLTGEPSSAVLQAVGPTAAAYTTGSVLTIAHGTFGPRFVGTVTGTSLDTTDPVRPVLTVRATSVTARLGRTTVGDVPWPTELDGARVARILAAAAVALGRPVPFTADPGTVQVLARDVDRQPAADLADNVATSALGVMVDGRDGTVRYLDADHAAATTPALELHAGNVPAGVAVAESSEQLANVVTVIYGPAPVDASTDRPRIRVVNAGSLESFGAYGLDVDSCLATIADAYAVGGELAARLSTPAPTLDRVQLTERTTPGAVGTMDVGAVVTMTGLPAPAPPRLALAVAGWTERWDYPTDAAPGGRWTLDVALVDAGWFGRFLRWVDVDSGTRWVDVDETLTWDAMADWGLPGYAVGRWVDVPASLLWATTDPDLTWAAWPAVHDPAAVAA